MTQPSYAGKLRTFTVTYDDGSTNTTHMNGSITDEEIRQHYIGTKFTDEDMNGKETTRKGVKVEFLPDMITCPHCGNGQPQLAMPNDQCYIKSCNKSMSQKPRD